MSIEREPSCEDVTEPILLPVETARRRIAEALVPIADEEPLALGAAAGRVLARAIVAPHDVPSRDNSAMDGYALSRESIPASGEAALALLGTAWAGRPFAGTVGPGEAVRIFTGAIMPHGADTVVIQEHAAESEGAVRIASDVEAGRNVRLAGEDVAAGCEVLPAGRRLAAADVGVIASLGIGRVVVVRRPRVAFFTTGDELCPLAEDTDGAAPPPGMLYDSNRHTLAAPPRRSRRRGASISVSFRTPPRPRARRWRGPVLWPISSSPRAASRPGRADHVTRVFHESGDVAFWKVAMRPGRPLAFGRLVPDRSNGSSGAGAVFFGLPGNPVAVMVTFLQFVQPAIRRLSVMSLEAIEPITLPARCLSTLRKSVGRVEYQRGVMRVEAGMIVVASTGKQGAGRLSSMSAANCLIVIGAEGRLASPRGTSSASSPSTVCCPVEATRPASRPAATRIGLNSAPAASPARGSGSCRGNAARRRGGVSASARTACRARRRSRVSRAVRPRSSGCRRRG